jgi:hypothetical protein
MIDKIPHDHAGQKARHCRVCGEFKAPEEFPLIKSKRSYGGYQAYTLCIDCEKQRKVVSHLQRAYGLSWEDYNKMVAEQDNKCYLCNEPPSDVFDKLVVDHCHKTGQVRKLLCRMCNIHLSKVEACPDYLDRVVKYLKGYNVA